ncbi:MAG: dTMP kinase [Anaerolineae bacterium]|nr:dTMP kinase [Anaerolineae bacterium]
MSLFITFEGPEGSGKTTQLQALRGYLEGQGFRVYAPREPGGTRIGDLVRNIVLNPEYTEMQPAAEILLFSAARAQLVGQEIRPRLAQGQIVLCDRYADSTLAYQGYGLGLDLQTLRVITAFATGGLQPDLTFLLDVPVEVGLARKRGQDANEWNRMERRQREYHERVRAGYREMAEADPARWCVLDATRPFDDVQAAIRAEVNRLISGLSEVR